ncbi:STAS domain-containing protein [Geodermatophilus sp. SYSU D01186]
MEHPHRADARRSCPLPDHHHAGAPAFSQVVDGRRGCIGATGDLTHRTADQLRGTVEALRRGGHRRILVDLHGLHSADALGLRALHTLQALVEADGGRLTLLHLPEVDGGSEQRPA